MIVKFLIEAIDPEGNGISDRQIEVAAEEIGTEAVDACGRFPKLAIRDRRFGYPIDDAAAAATTEDHGIGTFVDLDSLDIIERPKILDVIADTIDKEIGSGILSSDGDLVAVALALSDRCARRVTENITNIL